MYRICSESHWLVVKALLQAQLPLRIQHHQTVLPQQDYVCAFPCINTVLLPIRHFNLLGDILFIVVEVADGLAVSYCDSRAARCLHDTIASQDLLLVS